jgi:lipopolysaccharide exporter
MSTTNNNYWLKSGFLTLLEKASGLVFSLGTVMILLRKLSKEEVAAWVVFLIVTQFLEMGRSGLIQNGLIRYLTMQKKEDTAYSAISTGSLLLNLAFSLVSNVLLWASVTWLSEVYNTPQLIVLLPVYYITNFVMAFFFHFNFVQQANLEFRGILGSTFFSKGVLFVWVVYCYLTNHPILLQHLAFALLIGGVLGAFASYIFARPHLTNRFVVDLEWIKKLVAYGKFVLGTNLSTKFYKDIDKLTLGHLVGPAAVAIYDAAGKITQMVEVPSFSIAAVVFPQSAQRMEQEGKEGIKNLYERSVGAILAIILPFLVLVLIFAKTIIWLFAGAQYMDAANVLRMTAFFGLFMPFAVQFGTILDSTGRPATNFAYTFLTAVLNLGLSYLLITKYGLYGAAMATLTGYSISFVLMQRLLYKDFGINALRAFGYVPSFYKMGFNLVRQKLLKTSIA